MIQAYRNLQPHTGAHIAGICNVQIAPREWVAGDVLFDFFSGTVINPLTLLPGRQWLNVAFVDESFEFDEKVKTSRAGMYYEISFGGLLNELDEAALQTLETLRNHEFITILTSFDATRRLIGNKSSGAVLQPKYNTTNNNGGKLTIGLDFSWQDEHPAPFYPF